MPTTLLTDLINDEYGAQKHQLQDDKTIGEGLPLFYGPQGVMKECAKDRQRAHEVVERKGRAIAVRIIFGETIRPAVMVAKTGGVNETNRTVGKRSGVFQNGNPLSHAGQPEVRNDQFGKG